MSAFGEQRERRAAPEGTGAVDTTGAVDSTRVAKSTVPAPRTASRSAHTADVRVPVRVPALLPAPAPAPAIATIPVLPLAFALGLASLVAGMASGRAVPAEPVSAAAPAQATPSARLSACQATSSTEVVTDTLRTCEETEIVVRAEAVCPVCPGGVNVVFIFPELAHDARWLRDEAFGVIDRLQSRSRDEYLDADIRVAVVRYNERSGSTTRLYLTDNVAAARGAVNVMEDAGCFPLMGWLDDAVIRTQGILRDAHEAAGLGDDDRTCDYVVLFLEGTDLDGSCGGFEIGINASRARQAARRLEREVDELLIGCPGSDPDAHCAGPRGILSNPRNYSEAPRLGALPRRMDDLIEDLVDPRLLRRVTIRQDLPPSVSYVPDSAAPTPGVVTASEEGTRLEWMWERVWAEGEHEVRYRVAPPEATGVYTVTGSVEVVDEMNRRRELPMDPAVFTVTESCIPPATDTPIPTATPSITPSRTPTSTPTPTNTATPTRVPQPAYLPIALGERCDESRRAADVSLVIDTSTSMLELTGGGRTKLDAALAAARAFVDTLNLATGRDRAAIVAFNAEARIVQPMTSDRDALHAALAALDVAQQTCLPCAIETGVAALDEAEARVSTRTLIMLTDGRSNPRPASEAIDLAAEAKAASILVFTIGIGAELDIEALEAIASEPAYFFRSADAEDLEAIYREIATLIPCPAFWPVR